jgi:hypothetical protein
MRRHLFELFHDLIQGVAHRTAHFFAGRYDEASSWAKLSLRELPDLVPVGPSQCTGPHVHFGPKAAMGKKSETVTRWLLRKCHQKFQSAWAFRQACARTKGEASVDPRRSSSDLQHFIRNVEGKYLFLRLHCDVSRHDIDPFVGASLSGQATS